MMATSYCSQCGATQRHDARAEPRGWRIIRKRKGGLTFVWYLCEKCKGK